MRGIRDIVEISWRTASARPFAAERQTSVALIADLPPWIIDP